MPFREARVDIARFHREHERFYAVEDLRRATEFKRWARALLVLADRWQEVDIDAPAGPAQTDARLASVAGCEDLNELRAISSIGVLFMEGEGRPLEIRELEAWLAETSSYLLKAGDWLAEKMDAGWAREAELPGSPQGHLAASRLRALHGSTINAMRMKLAGALAGRALRELSAADISAQAVRREPDQKSSVLRKVGWMLDRSGVILADKSNELSASELAWTGFMEGHDHGGQ